VNGLESYLKNPEYDIGKEIIVVGGGDTAIDDSRTAKRLSKGNVTLVYRRTENEMHSDPIMVEEAREEGVQFRFLTDPKSFEGKDGKLDSVVLNTMKLGEPDSTGRRKPEPVSGQEFVMKCDTVLLALGRGPNSFLQIKEGLKMGKKNSIAMSMRVVSI